MSCLSATKLSADCVSTWAKSCHGRSAQYAKSGYGMPADGSFASRRAALHCHRAPRLSETQPLECCTRMTGMENTGDESVDLISCSRECHRTLRFASQSTQLFT